MPGLVISDCRIWAMGTSCFTALSCLWGFPKGVPDKVEFWRFAQRSNPKDCHGIGQVWWEWSHRVGSKETQIYQEVTQGLGQGHHYHRHHNHHHDLAQCPPASRWSTWLGARGWSRNRRWPTTTEVSVWSPGCFKSFITKHSSFKHIFVGAAKVLISHRHDDKPPGDNFVAV